MPESDRPRMPDSFVIVQEKYAQFAVYARFNWQTAYWFYAECGDSISRAEDVVKALEAARGKA